MTQPQSSHVQDALSRAGLAANETKAYLALIKLGPSGPREVAAEAGLFSANAYDALAKLEEKKLATKSDVGGKLRYTAAPPRTLLEEAKRQQAQLEEAIKALEEKQQPTPAAVHTGMKAIEETAISLLDGAGEYVAIVGDNELGEAIESEAFHAKRVSSGIFRKAIVAKAGNPGGSRKRKLSEISFAEEKTIFPGMITAKENKVTIAVGRGEQAKAFVIKDEQLAQAVKDYFEKMRN